ncbi:MULTISPECIES: undecaprenyl-diphosphate phosphatase [unclassified Nodularia (in: cyanobacteria)]|uniref:undecaprenyl-diphosphate phosphatase n=1 Tax=unclassified Nodularia (in: cyanobacteria) TaxID=2656917 RepID=UPI00187F0725|nr:MULTISPECIES: undecaprenyl-diphosphate phosphatase [unclassified Nodularia (in: cyanobacteria)]MBE9200235.1 undecaprenyl-diphosphate phosphatase [Nodularia sp. LEGE 06071]MCC2694276.1 undecaprenyl-diphosphate phosphatase [Nodularia sp. LEGE 04288]
MALSKRQCFMLLSAASAIFSVAAFPRKVLSTLPNPALDEVQQQMNILQAIFLGFVQGMTEFLPISSSAHLKVVPVALGWGDPGVAFTAIIQLGSIVAVLWYFWGDMTQIIKGATKAIALKNYASLDFQLFMGIILGTIPILVFGLLIKRFIPDYDNSPLRSLTAIAIASIFMSLLLGLAEKLGKRQRDFQHLTMKDGLLMGLAQTLALIPGVSRSGSTITGGLFMSLERETAARFSFLLGIPAITLAGLIELKDFLAVGVGNVGMVPMVVGTISSAIFSYIAIAGLIQFLKTQSTWVFIWYRLAFGIAILGAISAGLLK